ncbi:hypothetical protein ACLKA7_013629 [Drosophila subpalustris]
MNNMDDRKPYFEVSGLVPGMGYNVFLIAHNSKGRSNATILQVYTLKDPEKQTVQITFIKSYQALKPAYDTTSITKTATAKTAATTTTTTTKPTTSDCVCEEDEFMGVGDGAYDDEDQSPMAYTPAIEDIRPFLAILAGILGSIFLVAIIIVVVVRVRGSSGRDRNNYSHPGNGNNNGNNSNTANGNGNLGILGSNNNGSLGIGTLAHNGGQSVQDMHRIGRDTCHVTSSLDSIDKNPDIIPQDGHDVDDEWTTKGHNRAYATAALAEQNAVITSTTYDHIMPTYAVVDKKSGPPTAHGQYIQYNTLIPVSKMGAYANQQHQQQQQHQQHQQHQQQQQQQQQKTELSYSELSAPMVGSAVGVGVQRLTPYCSATLGRPRQTDLKRAEPNIYSQVNVMMDDEILADWQAATTSGHSYVAGAVVDNVGGDGPLLMPGYATRV